MWKFPTSTMVSKGVFSIRGMGLINQPLMCREAASGW